MKPILSLFILLSLFTHLLAQETTPNLAAISQTTTVNGITMPYYDLGEGPVVLLLQGFPDSRYLWRNQL